MANHNAKLPKGMPKSTYRLPNYESKRFKDTTKEHVDLNAEFYLAALPMFYKRVLHQSLQEAVQAALDVPVSDQLSLLEELAIIRSLAADCLNRYSIAIEMYDKLVAEKASVEVITRARAVKEMYAAEVAKELKSVANFCKKASEVDSASRDKFSIHTVNSLIGQLTRIIFEICDRNSNKTENNYRFIAEEFNERLKTLKVPKIGVESDGTTLTPDQDVIDMDDTIPKNDVE